LSKAFLVQSSTPIQGSDLPGSDLPGSEFQGSEYSNAQNFSEPSFFNLVNQQLANEFAMHELSVTQLNALPPITLAYIGDAVFELYVRSRLLLPTKRIRDYHTQVVANVKAEQQAQYIDILLPHLTDTEKDLLRRGRNAVSGRHRRADAQQYQKATGFEALLGFLYLSDQQRLFTLLGYLAII